MFAAFTGFTTQSKYQHSSKERLTQTHMLIMHHWFFKIFQNIILKHNVHNISFKPDIIIMFILLPEGFHIDVDRAFRNFIQ